eukprot:6270851-Amphidinium_carterae.1
MFLPPVGSSFGLAPPMLTSEGKVTHPEFVFHVGRRARSVSTLAQTPSAAILPGCVHRRRLLKSCDGIMTTN